MRARVFVEYKERVMLSNSYRELILAANARFADRNVLDRVVEFMDELLDCVTSERYEDFAEEQANGFWDLLEEGAGVPESYMDLFRNVVEKVPALRDPLLRALRERDPARGIYEFLEGKDDPDGAEGGPQPPGPEFMRPIDGVLEGRSNPPGG